MCRAVRQRSGVACTARVLSVSRAARGCREDGRAARGKAEAEGAAARPSAKHAARQSGQESRAQGGKQITYLNRKRRLSVACEWQPVPTRREGCSTLHSWYVFYECLRRGAAVCEAMCVPTKTQQVLCVCVATETRHLDRLGQLGQSCASASAAAAAVMTSRCSASSAGQMQC